MNFSDKMFFALGNLISAAGIIFSRDGLAQKLDQLDMLEGVDRRSFNRSLRRLVERNFIKSFNQKGQLRYRLTEKGMRKITELKFKEKFVERKKWDGLWRVVIFDIPEEKKSFREAFRRRLRFLDFFPLQKSVFVFPFECESKMNELADFFNIGEHLQILLVKSFGSKDEEIKNFFKPFLK
ncbi:MAG: hypothetical protein PHQ47_02190 [Candidatus Portnoybacteria bacterium]|nr:hypothetical protein [Candidatus Portnoybacteria bacterium]